MESIKILFVSSGDLVGSRFNGFDWLEGLSARGVDAELVVNWNKNSQHPKVKSLSSFWSGNLMRKIKRLIYQSYLNEGVEFGYYPWSKSLFKSSEYKRADLIHMQIVHDGTLDFGAIQQVLREKPVLWTWHDPWILTGHCIYPMTCHRFEMGCGECPDLSRPFTVKKDLTRQNRFEKQKLISNSQTIHVSTDWFKDLINTNTPKPPKIETLPFGLPTYFMNEPDRKIARRKLGIGENEFVIGIRSAPEPQKNFELFRASLAFLPKNPKITILTIQETGLLDEFKDKFEIIELPWTNQVSDLLTFYEALDLFIMPSQFETFGFMGIESMSRGVPVVGLSNTALDEVCRLETNGFVTEDNPLSLSNLLDYIIQNPALIHEKSKLSKEYVHLNFSMDIFLDRLVNVYKKTISDFR
jgi:glycosyltransferase involved in cell wall biosynthesis